MIKLYGKHWTLYSPNHVYAKCNHHKYVNKQDKYSVILSSYRGLREYGFRDEIFSISDIHMVSRWAYILPSGGKKRRYILLKDGYLQLALRWCRQWECAGPAAAHSRTAPRTVAPPRPRPPPRLLPHLVTNTRSVEISANNMITENDTMSLVHYRRPSF